MKQLISLPLYSGSLAEYAKWSDLQKELQTLSCDGIEAIWGGEPLPVNIPEGFVIGYHLMFYPDWLDFYREDREALLRKFGSMEMVKNFYGGLGRDTLLRQYREDLERAARLGVRYVVFHVSDVSIEEGYTYRWLHSDEEVIDASIELINTLLDGRDWPFIFLVENQWWPGLTMTDPRKTARLLDGIHYPKKGIMLDTGHLMNTCTRLRTQKDGVAYIQSILDRHGSMVKEIKGIHLHQSLSGTYVESQVGTVPSGLPEDYFEQYRINYNHILQIDQHRPWTDPAIPGVIEQIGPEFLTHELAANDRESRFCAVSKQIQALKGK